MNDNLYQVEIEVLREGITRKKNYYSEEFLLKLASKLQEISPSNYQYDYNFNTKKLILIITFDNEEEMNNILQQQKQNFTEISIGSNE